MDEPVNAEDCLESDHRVVLCRRSPLLHDTCSLSAALQLMV